MLKLEIIFIKNPWKWDKPLTYLSWIIRAVTKKYNTIKEFVPNHAALKITFPDGKVRISDFQSHYKYRLESLWKEEDINRVTVTYPFETTLSDKEILYLVENASSLFKGYEHRKLINYLTRYKLEFSIFPENSKRCVCFEWCGLLKGHTPNNYDLPRDLISL
jgi:hypothetical protein